MRRSTIAILIAVGIALVVGGIFIFSSGDDDEATSSTSTAAPTTSAPTSDTQESAEQTTEATQPETTEAGGTPAAECAAGKTVSDGVLTIATGDPAFPPYVLEDDPASGQGFEAAVGTAVARELGFEGDSVTWIRTAFDAAIAPGPKDFDFNLQQYTVTDDRSEIVDFSEGYYSASQAIFGLADSSAAGATTLEELKGLKIGVAAGTTSVTYVEEVIQPDSEPLIFNDNASAKQALESNQIDAIVSDLPTALFITAVEIEGTTVFGQIEGSGTDEFGLLLAKDSSLTECVNLALAALRDSGELASITEEWMADFTEAPVISL